MSLYSWNLSATYRPIPCNTHPLCMGDNCNTDGQCTYKANYASASATFGIVSEERFTLGSNTSGRLESINLHMNCGFLQDNFENFFGKNHLHDEPDLIAGILGLGVGQWSFVNQLGVVGEGKFSYCFETFNDNIEGSDTYLRFGADARFGGIFQKVRTTSMVVPPFPTYQYYLNLEDISVGNKRVGFPIGTFKLTSQKEGGAIIDSGTPISMIYRDHFNRVADLVKAHFRELGIDYIGTKNGFDLEIKYMGSLCVTRCKMVVIGGQFAGIVAKSEDSDGVCVLKLEITTGLWSDVGAGATMQWLQLR
ncbi:aspartic proteinase CDR1-like [Papaver somniferum]|uniref:aspartic proteinase CDR1-like n=1 Tax=Papaver somniferum TaxID=3469 RepID=UPI000E705F92|nr:aspartic proteinase CDR1-like [Papaver somniferum]